MEMRRNDAFSDQIPWNQRHPRSPMGICRNGSFHFLKCELPVTGSSDLRVDFDVGEPTQVSEGRVVGD
ncbi:unnamed protein product [Citrullus colocynthis]|uniref:Uncharacterized protein n=1 Tax=Citrullus colocynthis TaxID=252529 RepID=A0ABP0Y679_9ROSI